MDARGCCKELDRYPHLYGLAIIVAGGELELGSPYLGNVPVSVLEAVDKTLETMVFGEIIRYTMLDPDTLITPLSERMIAIHEVLVEIGVTHD